MSVSHAGGKCESELQILSILGIDLIKRTVSGARVIFCGANPLSVVGFEPSLIGARLIILFERRLLHRTGLSEYRMGGETAHLENCENCDR